MIETVENFGMALAILGGAGLLIIGFLMNVICWFVSYLGG